MIKEKLEQGGKACCKLEGDFCNFDGLGFAGKYFERVEDLFLFGIPPVNSA